MNKCFPDISTFEWVAVETILTSWLSIDSSDIRVGEKERTYDEWLLLLDNTRGDESVYPYDELVNIMDVQGFLIPLPYRIKDDIKIKCNGHHRLVAAIDLGYKFIPYVFVDGNKNSYFDITDFEEDELKTLLHPENPTPKFPIK